MKNQAVGVIGAANPSDKHYQYAVRVGKLLAERGLMIICGGLGGVMEGVCRGASEADGLTVGILPGDQPQSANPYVRIAIATGMGEARNKIIINSCKAFIAISGGYGTLSEIAFALASGKTVIGLETWEIEGVIKADTPERAVNLLLESLI